MFEFFRAGGPVMFFLVLTSIAGVTFIIERGLVILEIIVGIAPLTGLVGTLHGLITLFATLGNVAITDNAAMAKGISIALNTTLMGLIVAIPSLIAWSYYVKKVETLAIEMESVCEQFLRCQYREKLAAE